MSLDACPASDHPAALARACAQLVDDLRVPALWLAADHGTVHVNRPWREYTGVSIEDRAHDDGWRAVVHADDLARVDLLSTRPSGTVSVELRLRCATGTYERCAVHLLPVHAPAGLLVGWICTAAPPPAFSPVGDDARQRVATPPAFAPSGVVVLDRDGRYVGAGTAPGSPHHADTRDARAPSERDPETWRQCEPHFRRVVEGAAPVRFAITARRADAPGRDATWEVTFLPVPHPGGFEVLAHAIEVDDHAGTASAIEELAALPTKQGALIEAIFDRSPVGTRCSTATGATCVSTRRWRSWTALRSPITPGSR